MSDENWVKSDKWWGMKIEWKVISDEGWQKKKKKKKIQTAPKIFSREMPFGVLQPLKVVVYKMSEDLI